MRLTSYLMRNTHIVSQNALHTASAFTNLVAIKNYDVGKLQDINERLQA